MITTLTRWMLALSGSLPVLAVAIVLLTNWLDPMSIAGGAWLKLAAAMVMIEFLVGWRMPDWKEEDMNKSWQALGQRC